MIMRTKLIQLGCRVLLCWVTVKRLGARLQRLLVNEVICRLVAKVKVPQGLKGP